MLCAQRLEPALGPHSHSEMGATQVHGCGQCITHPLPCKLENTADLSLIVSLVTMHVAASTPVGCAYTTSDPAFAALKHDDQTSRRIVQQLLLGQYVCMTE